MKTFGLLLIALFTQLFILPANAQNRIGVVAGLNLANLSSDELDDTSFRVGLGAGSVLDLSLNDRVTLCLEPMSLQKGSDLAGKCGSLDWKLDYIELPVMLKLALSSSSTQPYLMADPAVGFKISAELWRLVCSHQTDGSHPFENGRCGCGLVWGVQTGISCSHAWKRSISYCGCHSGSFDRHRLLTNETVEVIYGNQSHYHSFGKR